MSAFYSQTVEYPLLYTILKKKANYFFVFFTITRHEGNLNWVHGQIFKPRGTRKDRKKKKDGREFQKRFAKY